MTSGLTLISVPFDPQRSDAQDRAEAMVLEAVSNRRVVAIAVAYLGARVETLPSGVRVIRQAEPPSGRESARCEVMCETRA
jgi:hypothetical protein